MDVKQPWNVYKYLFINQLLYILNIYIMSDTDYEVIQLSQPIKERIHDLKEKYSAENIQKRMEEEEKKQLAAFEARKETFKHYGYVILGIIIFYVIFKYVIVAYLEKKKDDIYDNMHENYERNILIVGVVLFIFFTTIFVVNPYDVSDQYPVLFKLGMLFIGFLFTMIFVFFHAISKKITNNEWENLSEKFPIFYKKTLKYFLVLCAGVATIIGIFAILKKLSYTPSLLSTILIFIFSTGFLALVYKFGPKLFPLISKTKKPMWLNHVITVIFYIPCLFVDLINYFKHQYNITTSTSLIILGIEFAIVGLAFVLPYLNKLILFKDGEHLLTDPVYLTKKKNIVDHVNLYKNDDNSVIIDDIKFQAGTIYDKVYNYQYAISAWFYINPQPPSTSSAYTKYTSILNYGGKPNVLYNGETNTFMVKTQKSRDEEVIIYKTKNIQYQRWNHLVINYNGGTLDVFLNNELVGTAKNIVPYMKHDSITVGEDPGIHGGIKNVVYFQNVLSKNKISNLYNFN
jgi:hypothetical protein